MIQVTGTLLYEKIESLEPFQDFIGQCGTQWSSSAEQHAQPSIRLQIQSGELRKQRHQWRHYV